jgi:hypothetical protein
MGTNNSFGGRNLRGLREYGHMAARLFEGDIYDGQRRLTASQTSQNRAHMVVPRYTASLMTLVSTASSKRTRSTGVGS